MSLIKQHGVQLEIVRERRTRHGDYRRLGNGLHRITVNQNLNKYRFLITLVHEIAHLVAFAKFGNGIKPHGKEWKYTFQHLMLPFIRPEIFPERLLPLIARHFKNPRASSDTDASLSMALQAYDEDSNIKKYIFEIPNGALFSFNNRRFKKGVKLRKRYSCVEINSSKVYLFQPNAQVEVLKK
ncbi:MAG: SprT-like domain-containing protein [Nonlabens sp.]